MRNFGQSWEALLGTRIEVAERTLHDQYEVNTKEMQYIPNHSECERGIYVHEERSDFVVVVKYKTVPPCNDGASQGAM